MVGSSQDRTDPIDRDAPGFRGRLRQAWRDSVPLVDLDVPIERDRPHPNVVERLQGGLAGILTATMAVTILVAVFYRFVLDQPKLWALQAPTFAYIWMVSFAAGLSDWNDDQISFDLLYELYPDGLKRTVRLVSNAIIAVSFLIVLPGTVDFIDFSRSQPSNGLPFSQAVGLGGIIFYFAIGGGLRLKLAAQALYHGVRHLIPLDSRREAAQ